MFVYKIMRDAIKFRDATIILLFTVLLQLRAVEASLSVQPVDITAKVGASIDFQCNTMSTSDTLVWKKYGPQRATLYDGSSVPDPRKFSANKNGNAYALTVFNVSQADGATYSFTTSSDNSEVFANLLVVASPVLSMSPSSGLQVGTVLNLTCSLVYEGPSTDYDKVRALSSTQDPQLSITVGSFTYNQSWHGPLVYQDYVTADNVTSVRSLSVNITLQATDAGSFVTCSVQSTKPSYLDSATQLIPLTGGPTLITINGSNDANYTRGTFINCTANGNPFPTVSWRSNSPSGCPTNTGPQGPGFAVLNVSCSGSNVWNCSASNALGAIWRPLSFTTVSASAIGGVKTTSVVNSTSVVNLTTLVRTVAPSVTTVNYGTTSKLNTTTQAPITNAPVRITSCNVIKRNNNSAPSGEYQIVTLSSIRIIQVHCEMGLNGGGYTFIQPFDWPSLNNADFQGMFQDRTSLLVRARKTDGTQPYGILKQLPAYSKSALNVGLNTNAPYTDPVNYASMGQPFMSFGFHPPNIPAINNIQGVRCNGVNITFNNCPTVSNSYVALFADFNESPEVTTSTTNVNFSNQILTNLTSNPSGRVMPAEYFTFAEFQFGQGTCAHYTTTGRLRSTIGVLSVAIGIR